MPRNVRASTNAEVNAASYAAESTEITTRNANGQTCSVIDPRFVYLAAALAVVGAYGYIRDTVEALRHRIE